MRKQGFLLCNRIFVRVWYRLVLHAGNRRYGESLFPIRKEKNAYAISSVHLDVQTNDSRSNPDIKSISNAQNKQVVFAPDGILIQNTENMYISLNDENGITIVSDLPICIHSDMNIALSAGENIEIGGARQVAIKQENVPQPLRKKVHR